MSAEKIRILHVIDSNLVGGAQDLVVGLCQRRNKSRFHVDVCVLLSHGKRLMERFAEATDSTFSICKSPLSTFRLLVPPRLLGVPKYDIVHTHLWISFMWGNAWLPSLGKRIICSINHTHDQVPSYYFPWYKRFARRNAVYFALNKTIQRDLEKFHIQRDKIVWQPIGIDEVFFFQVGDLAEVKRKYKIEDTDKIILRVARLEKDKKHELFFDAMTTIVRNVPDVKLFVAGEGAQRSALEQYISQRQLNGKVIICGECRNDLPALNRIARLAFALGWGSAMTESMFCGLPMISFNEVGADEIISDGVNGRIVPVNDTDALARCAIELLNDDTARSAMGEAGRKYVQNRFTYKKVVEAYERFYEFPEYDPHVPGNMV